MQARRICNTLHSACISSVCA